MTIVAISPVVQNYAWGARGSSSLVGRLVGARDDAPYAELWMGAHPQGDAKVVRQNVSLSRLIEASPQELLGERAFSRFGPKLPFLLKVLSIAQPLSIQLHPDLANAKRLHALDPHSFPDENHKPEVAVALTTLSLLHGVRPPPELRSALASYPEIAALCPARTAAWSDAELARNLFTAVYRAKASELAAVTAALQTRLGASSRDCSAPERYFLRAFAACGPVDPGLLCFFLLNYREIPPGSAIFTPANVPHAYLSGDIIECMANSNNVVRAGLTQKQQHPDILLELMDFEPPRQRLLEPTAVGTDGSRRRFCPPVDEFWVEQIESSTEAQRLDLTAASIAVCLEGALQMQSDDESIEITAGQAVFITALTRGLRITQKSGKSFLACIGT